MKLFEDFITAGIVKKITPDIQRVKNLILESERRIHSLNEQIQKIGIKNENANDYIVYCHDILMDLIRAKMLLNGYNSSGYGAHEAEVAYLKNLGFNEADVQFADKIRYFRNSILYYGTALDKEYAKKVTEFLKKIYSKLK
jgi:hypothetical protein